MLTRPVVCVAMTICFFLPLLLFQAINMYNYFVLLLGTAFVLSINQITDVKEDTETAKRLGRISTSLLSYKPLPIVNNFITEGEAKIFSIFLLLILLFLSLFLNNFLRFLVLVSLFLGVTYSYPPRIKNVPFLDGVWNAIGFCVIPFFFGIGYPLFNTQTIAISGVIFLIGLSLFYLSRIIDYDEDRDMTTARYISIQWTEKLSFLLSLMAIVLSLFIKNLFLVIVSLCVSFITFKCVNKTQREVGKTLSKLWYLVVFFSSYLLFYLYLTYIDL